jgi:hypothetical protein
MSDGEQIAFKRRHIKDICKDYRSNRANKFKPNIALALRVVLGSVDGRDARFVLCCLEREKSGSDWGNMLRSARVEHPALTDARDGRWCHCKPNTWLRL